MTMFFSVFVKHKENKDRWQLKSLQKKKQKTKISIFYYAYRKGWKSFCHAYVDQFIVFLGVITKLCSENLILCTRYLWTKTNNNLRI